MNRFDDLVDQLRDIAETARTLAARQQEHARRFHDGAFGPMSSRHAYHLARKDADSWALADQRYRAAVEMREKATAMDEMLAHGYRCRVCGDWRPAHSQFCGCE